MLIRLVSCTLKWWTNSSFHLVWLLVGANEWHVVVWQSLNVNKREELLFKRSRLKGVVRGCCCYLVWWRSASVPFGGHCKDARLYVRRPWAPSSNKRPHRRGGLSLRRPTWEWDWTVQPCWKYICSTLIYLYSFIYLFGPHRLLQMSSIGPGACW